MPGNEDHLGLVPARRSDGGLLHRRTWPEPVSTLTQNLSGVCQARPGSNPPETQPGSSRPCPTVGSLSARQPPTWLYTTADDRRTVRLRATPRGARGPLVGNADRSARGADMTSPLPASAIDTPSGPAAVNGHHAETCSYMIWSPSSAASSTGWPPSPSSSSPRESTWATSESARRRVRCAAELAVSHKPQGERHLRDPRHHGDDQPAR